jgi:hypothetical protein
MKSYLKQAILDHPKSTAAGLATLAAIAFAAFADARILAEPLVMGLLVGAIGSILYGPTPKGQ